MSLDLPAHADAASSAPEALLSGYPEPVIIDEVQYAPSSLRQIKACIDEQRYVYLGSYPELHVGADPDLWFPAYVATYLERDVRNVLRVTDLPEFNRFLRACALRTAQVLNCSDLARDTGIAPNTARKWLGLLPASAVVALFESYYGNRAKRLIKAPKLVVLDSGLAGFLAGFRSERKLAASALVGAFWELGRGSPEGGRTSDGVDSFRARPRFLSALGFGRIQQARVLRVIALGVVMHERRTFGSGRGDGMERGSHASRAPRSGKFGYSDR